jgi:hypothetical protein
MTARHPRLLIPDNTPLSLLSMIGADALDWVFALGAEVWITDMVRHEALRDPDPDHDQRATQRATLSAWFIANANRIRIQPTPEGDDYAREMRNWERGGRLPADKPSWRNRGERSILDLLPVVGKILEDGEAVVLLIDDRAARAVLIQAAQLGDLEADIMATESFLAMLDQDLGIVEARSAWLTIQLAAGGKQPQAPTRDPVYLRKPL